MHYLFYSGRKFSKKKLLITLTHDFILKQTRIFCICNFNIHLTLFWSLLLQHALFLWLVISWGNCVEIIIRLFFIEKSVWVKKLRTVSSANDQLSTHIVSIIDFLLGKMKKKFWNTRIDKNENELKYLHFCNKMKQWKVKTYKVKSFSISLTVKYSH